MKKLTLIFIIHCSLLIPGTRDCIAQSITWQHMYDGPTRRDDEGFDICNADNGNFFLVGSTLLGGNYYIYVLKINPYGDTIWAKTVGGGHGFAIVSSNDGCVLTGTSGSTFSKKLDFNGNLIWEKFYGSGSINCWDIIRTSDSGYIACGIKASTDGYIFKVDSIGNLQWQKVYPGSYIKIYNKIEEALNRGYIAVGADIDFDSARALVTKIDSVGNVEWEKKYSIVSGAVAHTIKKIMNGYLIGGSTEIDSIYRPYFIKIDLYGNIYYTKTFQTNTYVYKTALNIINSNRYVIAYDVDSAGSWYRNGKVIITDSMGTILHQKILPSGGYMVIYTLLPVPNGDIIAMGINDTTDMDIYAARLDSLLNTPPIGIETIGSIIPRETHLFPNYPNPFNPFTYIHFQLSQPGTASIKIYDITGKQTDILFCGFLKAGEYRLKWDAARVSSGIYFALIIVNENKYYIKMILVK